MDYAQRRVSGPSPGATDAVTSSDRDRLPNFLIIGAAKSGTTSLAAYLSQHPDVFIPAKKEPNYFALKDRRFPPVGPAAPEVLTHLLYNLSAVERPDYLRLFEGQEQRQARGEASVRYLYFDQAAQNIRAEIPDVRLVAILRDPVARAYSHFNMNRQYQLEPLAFPEALEAEEERRAAGWGWDWHYAAVSHYAAQLSRYFRLFGREAVTVHLQDDLVARPKETFGKICQHIGVDPDFEPDFSVRSKVSYLPKNLWLDRAIHWPHPVKTAVERAGLGRPMLAAFSRLKKRNLRPAPKLNPEMRRAVAPGFERGVTELEDLLGRKLPWGAQS